MRTYSSKFAEKNSALTKKTRWVVVLSFDDADTDLHYFTSHYDCEVPPGTAAADVTYNVLRSPVVTSQKLDVRNAKSSIGTITFDLIDKDNAVTNLLKSKLDGGNGVRHKRVVVYRGYEGLAWADYQIPPGGTQVVDGKLSSHRGRYTFRCRDRQRAMQDDVFDVKHTTLITSISATDSTITVNDTSDFEMVAHGASFSDAPNATVGYIKIEKEKIRYTGKTATTFTGCTRGALNTKAVAHDVDATADVDRRLKVSEVIYLEMPGPKMAYAILTGILYNQSGATLPAHWHLGISTSYVSTSGFAGIGSDLWNPADDATGFVLRFDNLTKINAKKFIAEQINLPMACFMPVRSDGQLGYRRMTRVISSASPVARLDASNVISYSQLDNDQSAVSNQYKINWNYDYSEDEKGQPTRENNYIDSSSVVTHKEAVVTTLNFKGLHGSRHSDSTIRDTFNALRDRYSGPPLLISVDCHQALNGVEIGDIVWCDFNQRDFVGGGDLNRAFEVIGYKDTGNKITLTLFGSSRPAGALTSTTAATVMDPSFYDGTGLVAGNAINLATTGSLTGTVWHITGDSTLTGGADMNDPANIYWYDGDVQLDDLVNLSYTGNVQIRIGGNLHYNGTIKSAGGGHPGSSSANLPGVKGFIGNTISGGGLIYQTGNRMFDYLGGSYPVVTTGANSSAPELKLVNKGNAISGIPSDMRPTSGGGGGNVVRDKDGAILANGGAGGAGAGALLIVCKSASSGVSGKIDSSGYDGSGGGYYAGDRPYASSYAGSGAGGYAGPVYFLIDGNSSTVPQPNTVISKNGNSPVFGGGFFAPRGTPKSGAPGAPSIDVGENVLRIQYIPPNETPAEDVPELTSPPTAITIQEGAGTKNSLNVTALEISVTPPADGNYKGAELEIRDTASGSIDSWRPIGFVSGTEELVVYVPNSSATYDVRANPVAISGKASNEYVTNTITLTSSAGQTVIGSGSKITTSSTTGNAVNGQGVEISTNGIKGYNSSGVAKFTLDPATGLLTAVDGTFSGTVTATAGAIGGWALAAGSMSAGGLVLDSANSRIRATSGSNYTQLSPSGFTAYDSVLGTTVNIPTDGTAPTFSSGKIKEMEYEIVTSNVGLRIGAATGYLTGNGMWAGRVGGVTKFHVGDPIINTYLAFDGTDVELGRNTELIGADSFYNKSVYSRYVSSFSDIMELIGSISLTALVNNYVLTSGTSVGGGDARISRSHLSTALSWSKFRAFSTNISLENISGKTWYFGIGEMVASSKTYAAFKVVDGDIMGAVFAPGGTEQNTLPFYSAAAGTEINYLLEYFPADRVDFYVDGVLRGSISLSSWSSSNGASVQVAIKVLVNTASPEGRANFSEFAFFQDK